MIKWGEANLDMRADKTTQSYLGSCFNTIKRKQKLYLQNLSPSSEMWLELCFPSKLLDYIRSNNITMADLPPSRSRISGPSRTRIGGGGRGGGTCRTPPTRGSSASWPGRASPARTAGASCSSRQSYPSLCRGGYFPRDCSFTLWSTC